jgi:hypothetical protein
MTPEAPLIVLERVTVRGAWGGRTLEGEGALAIYPNDVQVAVAEGRLTVALRQLTDATLDRAAGVLQLHRSPDLLSIASSGDLAAAWTSLVASACPMPEFARGLRTLGHARGGAAEQQLRFFGPLLAARRRVADAEGVERRVAQFDSAAIARHLLREGETLANERHPSDLPRARALAAHLEEALEPCLRALELVERTADGVHGATAGQRFVAWRRWTTALRRVFLAADTSWGIMTQHLSAP